MREWLSDPAGQVALFAVIEAGVLAWLYRSRRRAAVGAAVAVPILGALVVLIDLVHESPREHIDRVIEQTRQAVLAADAEAVIRNVDPDYDHQGVTYEGLRTWLPAQLQRWRIASLHVADRQFTTVAPTRITVRLQVRASGRSALGFAFVSRSRWRLTFLPLADRWVAAEIEPIAVDDRPFNRLTDLP
jgi:hypothetical protein